MAYMAYIVERGWQVGGPAAPGAGRGWKIFPLASASQVIKSVQEFIGEGIASASNMAVSKDIIFVVLADGTALRQAR